MPRPDLPVMSDAGGGGARLSIPSNREDDQWSWTWPVGQGHDSCLGGPLPSILGPMANDTGGRRTNNRRPACEVKQNSEVSWPSQSNKEEPHELRDRGAGAGPPRALALVRECSQLASKCGAVERCELTDDDGRSRDSAGVHERRAGGWAFPFGTGDDLAPGADQADDLRCLWPTRKAEVVS